MDPRRSVLIVDESDESREVLRTVLEHRGLRILEASAAGEGLELARQHHVDLIVMDLETEPSFQPYAGELAGAAQVSHTPLVLLGSARRRAAELAAGQFMAKPYHYAPLIRKIEELLDAVRQPVA